MVTGFYPPDWRELVDANDAHDATGRGMTDVLTRARAALSQPEPENDVALLRAALEATAAQRRAEDDARIALAQPEPEGPTDEELALIYQDCCRGCEFMDQGGFEDAARAVLAHWGNQFPDARKMVSPAPPAEGEVAELVALIRQIALAWEPDACLLGNMTAGQLARAADLLEQRHPEPVPVSERLPGPEDCDAEGFCWWFSPADPSAGTFGVAACWVLRKHEPEDDFRTHWLPATALPVPGQGEI